MFIKLPKISLTHIILFSLTVLTTLIAGAIMQGVNIFTNPLLISKGVPFSITLLFI